MVTTVLLNSPVIWLLCLLSVLTLAVILERFFFLSRVKSNRDDLIETLKEILKPVATRDKIERAKLICHEVRNNHPLSKVMLILLDNTHLSREDMVRLSDLEIQKQLIPLQKRFTILNTSTAIAPLLGLLGTVLGMIRSFIVISQGDQDGLSLASGISEALITTAFGLVITIPGIIFYNYFIRKVNKVNDDLEIATMEIIDHIKLNQVL